MIRAELAHYTGIMAVLFPVAVLVMAFVHFEAFRTLQATLLPLFTALISVVWALAIMGWLGQPLDTWSAMTPVLILAIAAGHAAQMLKRYYEELSRSGSNTEAVVRTLVAVGSVMLISGIMAAAGFASLATFSVTSMRAFGLVLALGILTALVIEVTFTPACRCLLQTPTHRARRLERDDGWLDRALEKLSSLVVGYPKFVMLAAVVLILVSAIGTERIEVDNRIRMWFSPDSQLRVDDASLAEKFSGTATLRILVEGREDNALIQPDVLQAMSDLQAEMVRDSRIGAVTSIADHVKRMHQAFQGGDPSAYVIPSSSSVIGDYLFLYGMAAGPDGLHAFVDPTYRRGVIRALSKSDRAAFSRTYLDRLQAYAKARLQDLPVAVGIAGRTLGAQTAMNDLVVRDKLVNILQVSVIIFFVSALVLRSAIGGLSSCCRWEWRS
jgi:predicted RND superfamily exporter protein